jgi:hypothetical protein
MHYSGTSEVPYSFNRYSDAWNTSANTGDEGKIYYMNYHYLKMLVSTRRIKLNKANDRRKHFSTFAIGI